MALITCSECRKELSDKASQCPSCGAPVSGGVIKPALPATSSRPVFVALFVLAAGGLCWMALSNPDEAQRALSQAPAGPDPVAAAKLAAEQQRKRERNALASNPNEYLEVTEIKSFDKGIVNDYRQVVGLTIVNRSHFAIKDLYGDATWVDARGNRVGSVPVQLKGSIPAGDTKSFSVEAGTLSSGTLQGSGVKVSLAFTKGEIID